MKLGFVFRNLFSLCFQFVCPQVFHPGGFRKIDGDLRNQSRTLGKDYIGKVMRFEEMLKPGCVFIETEEQHGASLRCFTEHDGLYRQLFDILQKGFLFQFRKIPCEIYAPFRRSQLLQRNVQVYPGLQGIYLACHGGRLIPEGHDLAGEHLYLVGQVRAFLGFVKEGIVGNRKAGRKQGILFPVEVNEFQGVLCLGNLVAYLIRSFQGLGLLPFRNEHDVAVFLQRK